MKKFTDAAFKFGHNVLAEVSNPLIMALDESEVLLLIRPEGFKLRVFPACLVLLEMSCDVIRVESFQEVKLVVVRIMEFFALLGLEEVVCAILIAVLDNKLFKLLLS